VYSTPWPHHVRDRRSVERIEARWPLSISGTEGRWIETTTQDLCSRGFYCVIPEIMQSGQEIDCRISIPDAAARHQDRWLQLLCRARVNRVEVRTDGYGLGCELRDYILLDGR
jgi:hypothetical protein